MARKRSPAVLRVFISLREVSGVKDLMLIASYASLAPALLGGSEIAGNQQMIRVQIRRPGFMLAVLFPRSSDNPSAIPTTDRSFLFLPQLAGLA